MVSFTAFGAALALLGTASTTFVARAQDTCSGRAANPEVYNFEVNGYPAKVIRDGSRANELPAIFGEDVEVISRMLTRRFLNGSEININFNVLYVDVDGEGLLIDAGNGPAADGMLMAHLETEGIPAASIKHILLSHAHGDHINGLLADTETKEVAFPEATVYISRVEYEYWSTDPV